MWWCVRVESLFNLQFISTLYLVQITVLILYADAVKMHKIWLWAGSLWKVLEFLSSNYIHNKGFNLEKITLVLTFCIQFYCSDGFFQVKVSAKTSLIWKRRRETEVGQVRVVISNSNMYLAHLPRTSQDPYPVYSRLSLYRFQISPQNFRRKCRIQELGHVWSLNIFN
jgi:hypothetical protein